MGLPMVLLLVANVLEVVNGKKNIMIVQMNMIAMLSGFYMFVSLVCKQTVLKELMKKCCSFGQRGHLVLSCDYYQPHQHHQHLLHQPPPPLVFLMNPVVVVESALIFFN